MEPLFLLSHPIPGIARITAWSDKLENMKNNAYINISTLKGIKVWIKEEEVWTVNGVIEYVYEHSQSWLFTVLPSLSAAFRQKSIYFLAEN